MSTTSSAPLRYRLSVPRPESHLVEVELRLPPGAPLRLEMAAWCPGSYLVRDYARYVRDLEVVAVSAGAEAALPLRQVSKHEWEVESAGAGAGADEIAVRYRVYGHELTVRTNHIDSSHAFLHGPAVYV